MSDLDPNVCPRCERPKNICVCDRIETFDTRVGVHILQHPGEQDLSLGSARLAAMMLPRASITVGLSWPSLSRAMGRDVEPARWAVVWPTQLPRPLRKSEQGAPFVLMTRSGTFLERSALDGFIVLDGTWSEAKTLWWRNPWLLRLPRIVLQPKEPSIYGKLRPEPKRNYVSTLEAIADALVGLGEPEETRAGLRRIFRTMVQRARDAGKPPAPASTPPSE